MIDVKINSNMKNETSVRLCVYLREIGLSLLDKNKGLPLYPVWVCVCVCWMDGETGSIREPVGRAQIDRSITSLLKISRHLEAK